MGIESVPCDCASLGTVMAMIGLFWDQYARGDKSSTSDDITNDFTVTCHWDRVSISHTITYEVSDTYYDNVTMQNVTTSDTILNITSSDYDYNSNECDGFDEFCSSGNNVAGKIILGLGIAATFFAIGMMLSQAPKFEAPKTWGFRLFLLFSGAFYIGGAITWYMIETCNSADIPLTVNIQVSYGASFWAVSIGGVLNFIGGIVSFINPEQKIKRKKRRSNSYLGNGTSPRDSGRNSGLTTPPNRTKQE